jgi:flagellar biosynthesis regulator FlbT
MTPPRANYFIAIDISDSQVEEISKTAFRRMLKRMIGEVKEDMNKCLCEFQSCPLENGAQTPNREGGDCKA